MAVSLHMYMFIYITKPCKAEKIFVVYNLWLLLSSCAMILPNIVLSNVSKLSLYNQINWRQTVFERYIHPDYGSFWDKKIIRKPDEQSCVFLANTSHFSSNCTALISQKYGATLGRKTLINEDVDKYCHQLVCWSERLNQQILFFTY